MDTFVVDNNIYPYLPTDNQIQEYCKRYKRYNVVFKEIREKCNNPKTRGDLELIADIKHYQQGWVFHMCRKMNIPYRARHKSYNCFHNSDLDDYWEISSYGEYDYFFN